MSGAIVLSVMKLAARTEVCAVDAVPYLHLQRVGPSAVGIGCAHKQEVEALEQKD